MKSKFFNFSVYFILIFFAFLFLLPLTSVFLMSFKTYQESLSTSPTTLPDSFLYLENYKTAFVSGEMMRGFANTAFIMFFSLLLSVTNAALVSYVISRFNNKSSKFMQLLFAGAVMLPTYLMQITTFQIVSTLGLFNTYLAPILLFGGTDIISVYIFLQFLDHIPISLDEAAFLDGCSTTQVFTKVIVPLLKPAIVTVVITKGIAIYNDFYIPYLYLPDQDKLTISTTLYKFKGPYGAHWEIICAGIIIIVIPVFIIFLILQKHIYNGMAGGVKE